MGFLDLGAADPPLQTTSTCVTLTIAVTSTTPCYRPCSPKAEPQKRTVASTGGTWDASEQPLPWVTAKATSEASGTFKQDPGSTPLTGPWLWTTRANHTCLCSPLPTDPANRCQLGRSSQRSQPTDTLIQQGSAHTGDFSRPAMEADIGSPTVFFVHYRGQQKNYHPLGYFYTPEIREGLTHPSRGPAQKQPEGWELNPQAQGNKSEAGIRDSWRGNGNFLRESLIESLDLLKRKHGERSPRAASQETVDSRTKREEKHTTTTDPNKKLDWKGKRTPKPISHVLQST